MINPLVTCLCALSLLRGAALGIACQKPSVKILGSSGGENNYDHELFGNFLPAVYGDTIDIYCHGSEATNITIAMDGHRQPAAIANLSTLKLTVNSDVRRYIFNCTDAASSCAALLTVVVTPTTSINVVSPNVRRQRVHRKLYFFVPINEDYEVFCSSSSNDSLVMFKNKMKDVQTDVVNVTTVKSKRMRETKNVYDDYYCYPANSYYYVDIQTPVRAYVDYPPTATDFCCVEYNEQINCTWNALSIYTIFTLYYTSEDGGLVRVCEDHSSKTTRLCEWALADVWTRGITVDNQLPLVLKACSRLFCANQTFHIDRETITKPPPPVALKILRADSRDVLISLGDTSIDINGKYPSSHKVGYRMPGLVLEERETSVSSSSTIWSGTFGSSCVTLHVRLPCPGAVYVLKVYSKYSSTSLRDEHWSDPASIMFSTDPRVNGTAAVDAECSMDSELITNKEIAVYEVKKLARRYRKDGLKIRKEVDALKQKRAKLEALSRRG